MNNKETSIPEITSDNCLKHGEVAIAIRLQQEPAQVYSNQCTNQPGDIQLAVTDKLLDVRFQEQKQTFDLRLKLNLSIENHFQNIANHIRSAQSSIQHFFQLLAEKQKIEDYYVQQFHQKLKGVDTLATRLQQVLRKVMESRSNTLEMKFNTCLGNNLDEQAIVELEKYLLRNIEQKDEIETWHSLDKAQTTKLIAYNKLLEIISQQLFLSIPNLEQMSSQLLKLFNIAEIYEFLNENIVVKNQAGFITKNQKNLTCITSFLSIIEISTFNIVDLTKQGSRSYLQSKIAIQENFTLQFLLLTLVKLSSLDEKFSLCSQNSALLLNESCFDAQLLFECFPTLNQQIVNSQDSKYFHPQNTTLFESTLIWANLNFIDLDKIQLCPCVQEMTHKGYIQQVAVSANNQFLVSSSSDNQVIIWAPENGQSQKNFSSEDCATALACSSNSEFLALGFSNCQVSLKNINEESIIWSYQRHKNAVLTVNFSANDKYLASGGCDNKVLVWDVRSGKEIIKYTGHQNWVQFVTFVFKNSYIASASRDGSVQIWNLRTGKIWRKIQEPFEILSLGFQSDDSSLAIGMLNGTIKIWMLRYFCPAFKLIGHESSVRSIAFSPDGQILASGSNDCTIILWAVKDGQLIWKIQVHTDFVKSVSFWQKGRILVSGSYDGTIKLWDIKNLHVVCQISKYLRKLQSVSISPNSELLAVEQNLNSHKEIQIQLWNLKTARKIRELIGHQAQVRSTVFSPNGLTLASESDDFTIRLWDLNTSLQNAIFKGSKENSCQIRFSSDGRYFFGQTNKTISVWSLDSYELIIPVPLDLLKDCEIFPTRQILLSKKAEFFIRNPYFQLNFFFNNNQPFK